MSGKSGSKILRRLNDQSNASTATIAVWYMVGNVFARGVAFISTPIFTRLLTKGDFGSFSNFTSWVSIISILATVDLTQSVARAKYDYDEKMDQYLSSITLFSNIITLLFYIVVELNRNYFTGLFGMEMRYIRLMFLYILFWPAFSYLQVRHRIYRKYKFFVFFSAASVIISTLSSVLLVVLMEDKLTGRILGYVVPVTIMNIVLWLHIVNKGRTISWDCIRFACAIAIPLIPHALSGILLGNSDRIMINRICGAESTAMYTLAYQISLLSNIIWTSMNQAWAPWLYDHIHARDFASIRKKSKIYLGVFSILIVGLLLVTPEVILVMGGKNYYEARYVMPPVILGYCFQFVYGMYVNIEIYEKKTASVSFGTVMAAMLNIGLNAIFIPRYGYIAAAYTTLVGYAVHFAFHYLYVSFRLRDLKDIYEKRFIFTILLGLTAASAIALVLFRISVVRYILLLAYVVGGSFVLYKHRREAAALFRRR